MATNHGFLGDGKDPGHRQWFIQSACATTGDGLYEAGGWSWRRDLDTPPKIHMELENWWIVNVSPCFRGVFSGSTLVSGGVVCLISCMLRRRCGNDVDV